MRISVIKYNILNLPDTILFSNGNRIVNLYDAAGHKYKSVVYTVPATAVTASYDLEHAAFAPDSMEYRITEYNGNIETCYTPRDTTRRIFNTIGYRADNAYYYFIKDHLGNICAVVNATADTVVQRTMYYASGVPMAQSWGRDTQPYLYNGKEFVEAHGLNSYDYGFRGYYAPTGRFTSIDPLTEQTPWQSPYAYAGNNFINAIDWMGLSGMTTFTVPQCIVTDISGCIIGGVDDGDENIYIDLDGKWDPNEGKEGLIWAGEMEHSFNWYMSTSGGGGIGGSILTSKQVLNALVCAAMNGRLSITITVSLGLEVGDKFFSREGNGIGLYGNLMSFELGSITLTNSKNNPISDYSYIRKNNRVKITQGYQLIVPTYEKSFDIYASDLEYVPASSVSEYSLTWAPYLSADGDYYLNFSFGTFISISVEIIYKNNNE